MLRYTGVARVGEDRQPHHGGLHQQAGQSSVHCPVEDGGEPGPSSPGWAPARGQAKEVWTVCTGCAERPDGESGIHHCPLYGTMVWVLMLVRRKEARSLVLCSWFFSLLFVVFGGWRATVCHGTIKVYAACISSCHKGFRGETLFSPLSFRLLSS